MLTINTFVTRNTFFIGNKTALKCVISCFVKIGDERALDNYCDLLSVEREY